MTLWGTGARTVDDTAARGGQRRSLRRLAPAGVGGQRRGARWTTMMGLTSGDGMSSTIHTPYYRHCQNLNSL